ncbi:hypothetical protein [Actinoplanes sp. N902-109]|uniref:hypothetical protein n=1 Tax=Actinoplanes sp. (strain N902-109) TaxID=649831 RepID=UPI000329663C|nr:hypothetical protein [Actinoplanes sp. N902-109]AGL19497.1 hypothetical protein L083_5987 [Actinoplanes sp. N902-109]
MARNIGTLGTPRTPVDLEFTYFGATIRVHPQASDAVELDFLDAGRHVQVDQLRDIDLATLDEEQTRAAVSTLSQAVLAAHRLIKDSLRAIIHPDDFELYWKLARDNGQHIRDLMADLKSVTAAIVEAETGFPTTPPAGSPPGPDSELVKSAGGSSSAAAPASSDADKALVLLSGRPDLQEFVVLQEETDQARQEQTAAGAPKTAAERLLAASTR